MDLRSDLSPQGRLISSIRESVYNALKRMGSIKNQSTLKYLGAQWDQVKTHLENSREAWNEANLIDPITEANQEIDHIKPCAQCKKDGSIFECNHYTNFQLLLRSVNSKKSSMWSDKDEKCWRNTIIFKLEYRGPYLPVHMRKKYPLAVQRRLHASHHDTSHTSSLNDYIQNKP